VGWWGQADDNLLPFRRRLINVLECSGVFGGLLGARVGEGGGPRTHVESVDARYARYH
jgi:hypothetical protein